MWLLDVFMELLSQLPFMGARGCASSIVLVAIAAEVLNIYLGNIPPAIGWGVIAGLFILSVLFIPRMPADAERD